MDTIHDALQKEGFTNSPKTKEPRLQFLAQIIEAFPNPYGHDIVGNVMAREA